jgi:YjbE family integral membrane protein
MLDMGFEAFTIALLQIIAIDIILGGDNAIVIALACRNLPAHQKRAGILWGTAGAIILRVILVFFASALMTTPGLRLIGGLLLLWIGVKLITEETGDDLDGKIKQNSSLIGAIRTIIIADFVMSLDNALAITAASKGNMFLVVFGLVLSVPIIIGGSAIILRMMERFPVIVVLGGGLLGWLGGDLMATDKVVTGYLPDLFSVVPQTGAIVGAFLVVVIGKLTQIAARRRMVGHDAD